jgi:predicted RNA binding protein YcfA (HicA-like mRNA interferase family)
MSKLEKLIEKILNGKNVTYDDAENLLEHLGFTLKIRASHHIFRKPQYHRVISLKKRPQLLRYQIDELQEVLKDHGHKKRD